MRSMATMYKNNTGLGADVWHPRLMAILSDRALAALDALYRAVERSGIWPALWLHIHVVFLGKPDGGWRPILLDCTMYRFLG